MSGRYLFHASTALVGGTDVLLPVSDLARIDEGAHARAMSKYEGSAVRRRLARTMVPVIGRRWTEVVFLSPVHPHALWSAWRDITGEELPPSLFWQIPLGAVPGDAVVFERATSSVGEPIDTREVAPLDRGNFRTLMQTTEENRTWLKSVAEQGKRGAWFNRTPHVLTAGPVTLATATMISWEEAPDTTSNGGLGG